MKHRKSRFNPHFKLRVLAALAASGNRWQAVEAEFNVPHRTLLEWHRHQEQIEEEAVEYRRPGSTAINAHFDMLTQQLLNTLPAKIEGAKLTDSLRALNMLNDLRQLFQAQVKEEDLTDVYARLNENINRYRRMKEQGLIKYDPPLSGDQEDSA